jgi:hypothetical protein
MVNCWFQFGLVRIGLETEQPSLIFKTQIQNEIINYYYFWKKLVDCQFRILCVDLDSQFHLCVCETGIVTFLIYFFKTQIKASTL